MIPSCHCGEQGVVLCPGTEVRRIEFSNLVVAIGTPDLVLCLPHARDSGWPNWPSEKQQQRRAA